MMIKFGEKTLAKPTPQTVVDTPLDRLIDDYFPQNLRPLFERIKRGNVAEVRFRLGQPALVQYQNGGETFLMDCDKWWICQQEDLEYILQRINQSSVYAWEEEYRRGYLTVAGGHRVGMAGKILLSGGEIRAMKQISSLNFRIARQVTGAADKVMPYIVQNGCLCNTLIAAPPGCGKTTLLRDMARQISDGVFAPLGSLTVGVVDERSEIAGMLEGKPQLAIGTRTDVLDGCPKSQGMMMLIRSMTPKVIITDEIGSADDALAMQSALSAGVKVITTIHGQNWTDLQKRPFLRPLLEQKFFERVIFLDNRHGAGGLHAILAVADEGYEPVTIC